MPLPALPENLTISGRSLVKLVGLRSMVARGKLKPAALKRMLDEETQVWAYRLASADGFILRWWIIQEAFKHPDNPAMLRLGMEAAQGLENRVMGKPTEKVAVAGKVHIEFGGLRPEELPGPEGSEGGDK
jgi:hypothetical protein